MLKLDNSLVIKIINFSFLKKELEQNNDVYEKALDMFNIIKGVPNDATSKYQQTKSELYKALLANTKSKFHDPYLLKNQNIQQFKSNILNELNEAKNKGEIDQKQFVKFFAPKFVSFSFAIDPIDRIMSPKSEKK